MTAGDKKRNICVITATYPIDGEYGGIFVHDYCKMLINCGNEVTVLYAKGTRSLNALRNHKELDRFSMDGVQVYRDLSLRFADTYTVALTRASIIKSCRRLYERYAADEGKPDLLVSHFSYPAGIGAAFISAEYGIPLVSVEHLSLFTNPLARPWMNPSLVEVINQSKRFVCVSEGLKEGIIKRTDTKHMIDVIPDMISDRYSYFPRKHDSPNGKFVFLSVGSLIKRKNHKALIEAFTKAFRGNPDVVLRIIGTGPLEDALRKKIVRLEMEEQIILAGAFNGNALLEEYIGCDCFVLLSLNETFGIVYREALAVGRPVISSKHKGIVNGWEDCFGILVDAQNEDNTVNALREMYADISKYNNHYLAGKMHEMYSSESIGNRYNKLFDEVLIEKR